MHCMPMVLGDNINGSFFTLLFHQPSEHQSFPPLCMGQVGYIALAWTQLKYTDGKSTSPPVTHKNIAKIENVTFRERVI